MNLDPQDQAMAVLAVLMAFQMGQAPATPVNPDSLRADAVRHANGRTVPHLVAARAVRVPVLDGLLDDDAWQTAQPISEFRQVNPVDGADPSERTEVRIVYTDDALYIGARLFDSDPAGIVALLARRDNDFNSDLFTVIIDSYHDHRTSFRFRTNPRGVKEDGLLTNDNSFGDEGWDPVWDVATRVDSLGWVAEMRIPFSQLRFNREEAPVWGVNFTRQIVRKNEFVRWSWAPNTEQGFASLFGHLHGLDRIPQPRRVEIMPYTVARSRHTERPDRSNPFDDGSVQGLTGGLDLKYGVTSGLTLDATINPDFGQVEADPSVVNLTQFETFFPERRPFFVEGANLFQFGAGSGGFIFGAPQLFYSRRIGRSPSLTADAPPGGWAQNPDASTILGAAKLSGQVGRWSLGVLAATTAEERARLRLAGGSESTAVVEPFSTFGVVSLRRAFRGGATGLGFLATSVTRRLDDSTLFGLRSSAYSAGLDFFHRFGGNRFVVSGTFSSTLINGAPIAIRAAQLSSARYYQRPDQGYVRYDSAATSLGGYAASVTAGKVSGNWTYGTDFYAYSPGFEANDAGFLTNVDQIFHGLRLQRRWLRPGRVFRNGYVSATFAETWNFGGVNTGRSGYLGGGVQFRNFWEAGINLNHNSWRFADKQTRGGPVMKLPESWNVNGYMETDYRRPLALSASAGWSWNVEGGTGFFANTAIQVRPSTALTFNISPSFSATHALAQYVRAQTDALATSTFGRRYVFGHIDQRTIDLTTRMDLALSPRLTFQLYAQPFLATGNYTLFKELVAPRTFAFNRYGTDGGSTITFDAAANTYTADPDGPGGPAAAFTFRNPDFVSRSLNGTAVLRWEYRPGSTLFLVWSHGQGVFDFTRDPRLTGRSFGELMNDLQQNTLLVKASYWINI